METHEIYIDGQAMDLGNNFDIALLFQSFFFTDIKHIVSNRSYTVKFPPTPGNLKAVGFCASETVSSDFPYKTHTVEYYRNGYRIIQGGLAVVLSIETDIEIAFTWGSIQNTSLLGKDKLSSLAIESMKITSLTYVTPAQKYGLFKIDFGRGQNINYMHPSIRASYIMEKVNAKYGLGINLPNIDKYIIPLITKESAAINRTESRRLYFVAFATGTHIPSIQPAYGSQDNSDYFTYSGMEITCHVGGEVTLSPNFVHYESHLNIMLNGSPITLQGEYFNGLDPYNYRFTNVEKIIVSEGDILSFETGMLGWLGGYQFTLEIQPEAVKPGMSFPLFENLPDMTILDFIKNILLLEGVFMGYANGIIIKSVDDILANLPNAIDWTDKLTNETTDFSVPPFKTFNHNELAQRNLLKWKDDDSVLGNYDGVLTVANTTLEPEKELFSLNFAPSDTQGGVALVPLYGADGSFKTVQNRILFSHKYFINDDESGVFQVYNYSLSFSGTYGIINRKYVGYQKVINKLAMIRVKCVLSDVDLVVLRSDFPVYFSQYGHSYAILRVQVKKNNECLIDLIKL